MRPGFGYIVLLVKIVSLDFLERVNLINKRLEQERGEKSTFSHQYSSIGLYCGAANPLVRSATLVCPDSGLIPELLSCCCKGSIAVACWNASLHILVVIAQATAVFCFMGTCSGYFVL